MDAGEERLDDDNMIEKLRGKTRRINRRALITAAAATLVALAFPER